MPVRCSSSPVVSPNFSVRTPPLCSRLTSRLFSGVSLAILQVPAALQLARAAAQHGSRQFVVRVDVGVAQAAAVENQAVIQQVAVAIRRVLQLLQEVGERLHQVRVDLGDVGDLHRIVLVMRDGVVPVGDADLAVRPVAAGAAQHERDHARHVGLEGDHLQVHHQLGVIFERFRRGTGTLHRRNLHLGALLLGLLDAPLDIADRFQVFAELVAVARAESWFPGGRCCRKRSRECCAAPSARPGGPPDRCSRHRRTAARTPRAD